VFRNNFLTITTTFSLAWFRENALFPSSAYAEPVSTNRQIDPAHHRFLHVVLALFFLWIVSPGICQPHLNMPSFQISPRARVLLQEAKNFQRSGNLVQARIRFQQAQGMTPGLPTPNWLKNPDVPLSPKPTPDRESVLSEFRTTPSPHDRLKLEGLLRNNPVDPEIRKALLDIAVKEGNSSEIVRHTSFFVGPARKPQESGWRFWLLAFLWVILLWQLFLALRDCWNHREK